ncbi:MAG: CotH kinase family protein [Tannerella sp.]|nr:CotH kinase family protein [Tannerella sp.]
MRTDKLNLTPPKRQMIRFVCSMFMAAGIFCACTGDLSDDMEKLKERVTALEAWQQTVNGNISAMQGIISVLQAGDYVESVTPLPDGSGYTMTFVHHEPVVIHHGSAGETAPQIGVEQVDGVWYWTHGGERISDGAEGYLRVSGIAPQVRINPESFEWETSVDSGATWTSTGVQASGELIFREIDTSHPDYVTVTLADEPSTVILLPKHKNGPRILSFAFKASDNPLSLLHDVACEISDSVIHVLAPYIMADKQLTPVFTFEGQSVQIGTQVQESGVTRVDFSSPVVYTVRDASGKAKKYTVKVYAFNGLPIVHIDTRKQPVNSTEDYVNATISITNTLNGNDYEGTMRIRGRGNSTWTFFPKKPYRIKLDEKAAMLGMPSDKDWVLLANYSDKSLLRTAAGFELSRLTGMPWTPRMRYVDVFLNGNYEGQYLLGEHVKASPDRISVDDGGFVGEFDANFYAQEPFYAFSASYKYPYTFKEPDPATAENTAYFMNLINSFEAALKRRDFSTATGYRKYIDVESFAQWYIISQFIASIDPNRYYFVENSTDGLLRRSPVWDLDCSFGYAYPHWAVAKVIGPTHEVEGYEYCSEMLEDPYFRQVVKKYWVKMKTDDLPLLYQFINETAQQIQPSALANYERWDDTFTETVIKESILQKWENEVQGLKIFLSKRAVWMDTVTANW